MQQRNLYIIAGPNGAGKTTASFTILPHLLHCRHFVNADEIARGISPFAPEIVPVQAGRIMLQRIEELLNEGEDFAFETTLAARTYVKLIKRAKQRGYKVFLVFFFIESVEQAKQRVAQRVSEGGHGIDNYIIERRYTRGLKNLIKLYMPICDNVTIYNNTNIPATLIAQKNMQLVVADERMWNKIQSI